MNYSNVEIYNYGLMDKSGTFRFEVDNMNQQGSMITDNGQVEIRTVALDELLKGKKVTFIKMDIEGSELMALKGAENIIKSQKPKLAICVYHKLEDIYEILDFILQMNPDYKFWLRHYCVTGDVDTILYAI